MNDNTVLRIKVPAHLYESVKQQLTLKEAKGKTHYGAGMEVVKEKKMKTTKDSMQNVEEVKDADPKKKTHSLEELMKAKEKLENKINEMGSANKKQPVEENTFADPNFWGGVGGILLGSVPILKAIYDEYKNAETPEEKKNVLARAKEAIAKSMGK